MHIVYVTFCVSSFFTLHVHMHGFVHNGCTHKTFIQRHMIFCGGLMDNPCLDVHPHLICESSHRRAAAVNGPAVDKPCMFDDKSSAIQLAKLGVHRFTSIAGSMFDWLPARRLVVQDMTGVLHYVRGVADAEVQGL